MSDFQLALDLGHRPALGRDDFLVAPCNAEAVAWLERWPDWPAHALAVYGPPGSGKSHLLAAFSSHHRLGQVVTTTGEALTVDAVPKLVVHASVVMVDDLDRLADETALFHLWNLTKETGRWLVLAGRSAPARLRVRLPDLASRLAATPAVGIGAPDDALLAAILVKQFADRQLRVGEDVVGYVLGRMERSFAAARAVVEAMDAASLARRRAISVSLARSVLEKMERDDRQGDLF
ncbi:HdaA/DnaA family protein [Magnetospirillum aberrantis]|uniref:DNA replication protein n=1 Tax=Magnetospirillum aberrantis SpK TaxID=908842 RepID=A0A7C9QWN4_9PROT|nr:DnaA/Hda family protein [Magnetospirillum aberrantis]NFV81941.1 DNA replication protein [Magnetospirillum aberrantis SpK]